MFFQTKSQHAIHLLACHPGTECHAYLQRHRIALHSTVNPRPTCSSILSHSMQFICWPAILAQNATHTWSQFCLWVGCLDSCAHKSKPLVLWYHIVSMGAAEHVDVRPSVDLSHHTPHVNPVHYVTEESESLVQCSLGVLCVTAMLHKLQLCKMYTSSFLKQ